MESQERFRIFLIRGKHSYGMKAYNVITPFCEVGYDSANII